MQQFEYIDFKQPRDFGVVLSTTFRFIKQNMKGLARAIYAIGLPVMLLSTFLMGSFYGRMMFNIENTMTNAPGGLEVIMIVLGYLIYALGFILVFAAIYEYIGLYRRERTNQIPLGMVWKQIVKNVGAYIGSGILVGIMVMAAPLLGMLMFFFADGAGMIAILVLLELGFFVFAIYLAGKSMYTQVAIGSEGRGGVDAIQRSFWATKDNWWITFGLAFVCNLIQSGMLMVIMIPMYIIMFAAMIFSIEGGGVPIEDNMSWFGIVYAAFMFFYTGAMYFTYTITAVALNLKFSAIVEEREGGGLSDRIAAFGAPDQEVDPESLL